MSLYLRIRLLLHSLLFVVNFLTLIAVAWSITIARHSEVQKVSPGAVLVLLGCIAYGIFEIIIWIDMAIPKLHLSRVRTELILTPFLICFQIIGAATATANLVQGVCKDQTSCTSLLILSWTCVVILLIYFLIVLVVTYDHADYDSGVWDALMFEYPWFYRSPDHAPPPPPKIASNRSLKDDLPFAPQFPDAYPDQHRRGSSWIPSRSPSPAPHLPALPAEARTSTNSTKSTSRGKWIQRLASVKRGVELPFPVLSPLKERRFETAPRNESSRIDAPRIDAPVSPEAFSFSIFEHNYDGMEY